MNEPKDPFEMTDKSDARPRDKEKVVPADQACLARIDKMLAEGGQEPDNIPAILNYFAATNMQLDLEYLRDFREIVGSRTKRLHEMPELPQMLAAHLGLSRQYHRDLDLAERFKQLKQKRDKNRPPRDTQAVFNASEKPR